jgi:gamma-glutamyl phosphate reductase
VGRKPNQFRKEARYLSSDSGRGNNFVYVNKEADLEKAMAFINGKTSIYISL